jgi:quercetin dioxygenase-like cupin family protein
MTVLAGPGEGSSFGYAGQPMHTLAGQADRPAGFAAMEITIPAGFPGPVPHAHDGFDEAIYVLAGRLGVFGEGEPQDAGPGSMFVAPRGHRHGFRNRSGEQARVLGIWAPATPAIAFMREIGPALAPGAPPDPEQMREIYARHASRLLP